MVCPTRATIFSTKDLWLIETAAVRNRMPGGVGGTAVMSRLPTRLAMSAAHGHIVIFQNVPQTRVDQGEERSWHTIS